jgi:diguanylate cyclase (GGDEF)-like protein
MQLAYILVADATADRQTTYRAAAQRYRLGLLLARDAQQALQLIQKFGPPAMLVANLATPEMQHLALNSISNVERDVQVVAFTSERDLRAFLRASPNAHKLHILNRAAPVAAVEMLLSRILRGPDEVPPAAPPATAADTDPLLTLTARTLEMVDAAGSAAYTMDPDSAQMRGVIRWTGQDPLRRCQYFLPRAIDQVLSSGRSVTLGDTSLPTEHNPSYGAAHALLASPIKQLDRTVGVACLFGDAPLRLSEQTLTAFEQLTASAGETTERISATVPRPRLSGARTRATDIVASAADADADADAVLAGTLDWAPTLLERQRGEFEVAKELARMRREQRQLSVVLFDVSQRFRDRQDTQPNLAVRADADDALQKVVNTFVRAVRQSDLPIRWSGNELVLVLPGVAGVEARAVAERVRAAMEAGAQRNVSVSGSVAELERDEQLGAVVERARVTVDQLIARGHNRVG